MRIGIRQGCIQTRYGRRGHVQVGTCIWVRHPSSLCTVPVLSQTHHHLFRAQFPAALFAVGGIAGGVEGRHTCIWP
ncbi:hypothetical protein L208DRAFT_1410413, partial [Tricholoma matsutake]